MMSDDAIRLTPEEATTLVALLRGRLRRIADVIEEIEARCMTADVVTPTSQEVTEGDLRRIWIAATDEIQVPSATVNPAPRDGAETRGPH